ncbi:AAA family ATPase [Mitsuokella multacida]|uniref:AAA family ATPase n=1 Tax=Mitsuokella multacida TaxID=52226 RepID=UPI003F639B26
MISEIRLKNFKCFKDKNIKILPLTILAGINSMGKSSVLESILLLRESLLSEKTLLSDQEDFPLFDLRLNNQYMRLGTGMDVLCEFSTENIIGIGITDDNKKLDRRWNVDKSTSSSVLSVDRQHISKNEENRFSSNIFATNNHEYIDFAYISADRLGPRSRFDIPDETIDMNHNIGSKGEYAAFYFDSMQSRKIPLDDIAGDEESKSIAFQVNKWMGCIAPETRIRTSVTRDIDAAKLTYYDKNSAKDRRSINVGFGLTYTFPIVLALLSVKKGGILLLENPEAHLHPKAQTMIGKLIAKVVQCGGQIILETHSDHIINGIRVAIKERILDNEKMIIDFFSASQKVENTTPEITDIYSDKNGKLSNWPKDFLSEWEDNLFQLL